MTNKYVIIPNVYNKKLDTYDPGIPIKFVIWSLPYVKNELSLMLKLTIDSDKVIEIKKRKTPYKYLKIFFNLSLKAIGKNLLFIVQI